MADFRIRQFFLVVFAFCLHGYATPSNASTAAESDWQAASPSAQCQGSYADPISSEPVKTGDTIDASANSIQHVEDQTTRLEGDILLRQRDQQLQADFATLDNESETYSARGNIRYRQPGLLIKGERMEGSLFSGSASISDASFLLHNNRLRGTADVISRQASGSLEVNAGYFTTCEPDSNTWAVTGDSIELHPAEGFGVARDVTLEVKDMPIAWFPYLRFPLDERRVSGLLLPSIGSDSDGGTDIAIPYYFNLAPNYDATYTLRSIWKRGVMHEGEFRFMNRYSTNTVAATYLPSDDEFDDRRIVDTTRPDDFDEQDRWLTHFSHRGRAGNWSSSINYTSVSDVDYFEDLGGFTGTDSSFNQQDNQRSSPALQRTGSVTYTRGAIRSSLSLRSFQELSRSNRRQYEILPRLSVTAAKQFDRLKTSVYAEYTAFDNASDSIATGQRAVLDAQAALAVKKPWGFLTPSLRLIHRNYSLDDVITRDNASITTALASIDAGLILQRKVTRFGQPLQQTLEPRVQYLFADHEQQEDLPLFDTTLMTDSFASLYRQNRYAGYDRISDANRLAVGITTRFSQQASGRNLLTASIGQMFHFEDREVTSLFQEGHDPESDTSPLYAEVSTQIGGLRLHAGMEFDTASGQSNRGKIDLKYESHQGSRWNFSYSMVDDRLQRGLQIRDEEETDLSFQWPISGRWQIVGRWNYGVDSGHTIESLLGVEYNDCCWKARIVFRRNLEEPRRLLLLSDGAAPQLVTDRRADSGVFFEFQLKGLGSLGGRLDSLLSDAVPGYRIYK